MKKETNKRPFVQVKLVEERENLETRRTLFIPEHPRTGGGDLDRLFVIGYENGREKWVEISLEDLRELYNKKVQKP